MQTDLRYLSLVCRKAFLRPTAIALQLVADTCDCLEELRLTGRIEDLEEDSAENYLRDIDDALSRKAFNRLTCVTIALAFTFDTSLRRKEDVLKIASDCLPSVRARKIFHHEFGHDNWLLNDN